MNAPIKEPDIKEPKVDEPKVDKPPSHKDNLEVRLKRVEILGKTQELKGNKLLIKYKQEAERIELEMEKLRLEKMKAGEGGFFPPILLLLDIAHTWYIDNERSLGTEPALRSIWTPEEMQEIKSLILKKAKKL